MKCWVDKDEMYPWHTVLLEKPGWLDEEYDIPEPVIMEYQDALRAFLSARKELMKAMGDDDD